MSSSVGHVPGEKWAFDKSVTDVFDDMLRRSIPQYQVMRDSVFDVGSRFVQPSTEIVDLGCSQGEAISRFVDRFGARNRYVLCEVSEPMLDVAKQRYSELIKAGIVSVRDEDLRRGYPDVKASLTLAILTIQFTPIEYRQRILRDVFKRTVDDGAFILVEKVLGSSSEIDEVLVAEYYNMKRANGYSTEEVERKRLSLEGVLVPVTAAWNEELLRMAGFSRVECFWRFLNFAAWIAIK